TGALDVDVDPECRDLPAVAITASEAVELLAAGGDAVPDVTTGGVLVGDECEVVGRFRPFDVAFAADLVDREQGEPPLGVGVHAVEEVGDVVNVLGWNHAAPFRGSPSLSANSFAARSHSFTSP